MAFAVQVFECHLSDNITGSIVQRLTVGVIRPDYSCRKATSGSMEVTRRAGIRQAIAETIRKKHWYCRMSDFLTLDKLQKQVSGTL